MVQVECRGQLNQCPCGCGSSASLPTLKYQHTTIAALSRVPVLPSPAAGFLRVFGALVSPAGIGVIAWSTGPSGGDLAELFQVGGAFGAGVRAGFQSVNPGFLAVFVNNLGVLKAGESLELDNQSATNTLDVDVSYVDIPDAGVTAFRVPTNGAVPAVLIPSPLAGKLFAPWQPPAFVGYASAQQPCWFNNRDAAFADFTFKKTGTVWSQNGAQSPGQLSVISQPTIAPGEIFTVELSGPAATEPLVWGTYAEVTSP